MPQYESNESRQEQGQNDVHQQAGNALAQQALDLRRAGAPWAQPDEANTDGSLLDQLSHFYTRRTAASATIGASGASGFLWEGPTMAQVQTLQKASTSDWGMYAHEGPFSHIRSHLDRKVAQNLATEEERAVLTGMRTRGLAKGIAVGALAIGGTIAVDMMFSDTKRSVVSESIDLVGLPVIACLPMNTYYKGAAIVGAHTLGRVYDKYFAT